MKFATSWCASFIVYVNDIGTRKRPRCKINDAFPDLGQPAAPVVTYPPVPMTSPALYLMSSKGIKGLSRALESTQALRILIDSVSVVSVMVVIAGRNGNNFVSV